MSDNQITNGRRAALALDAISTYTWMSPYAGLPEDYFFLDSEREAGPGTDHDCLADLLCGLMHVGSTASVLDRARTATATRPRQCAAAAAPHIHRNGTVTYHGRGTHESARLRSARERIRPLALRPAGPGPWRPRSG